MWLNSFWTTVQLYGTDEEDVSGSGTRAVLVSRIFSLMVWILLSIREILSITSAQSRLYMTALYIQRASPASAFVLLPGLLYIISSVVGICTMWALHKVKYWPYVVCVDSCTDWNRSVSVPLDIREMDNVKKMQLKHLLCRQAAGL